MTRRKKIRSITLFGRRWFERSGGNTYHTVNIYVDGECVHQTMMQYGYDSQYIETAAEWLDEHWALGREHYDNGGVEPLWSYCRDRGIEYIAEAADVARKADL